MTNVNLNLDRLEGLLIYIMWTSASARSMLCDVSLRDNSRSNNSKLGRS